MDRNILYGILGYSLPETDLEVNGIHIVFKRNGRGGILRGEQIWVIGASCRITKMIRLKIFEKRNKNIRKNFAINTTSFN